MFYCLAPFFVVGFFLSVSPVFSYNEPWQLGGTLLGIVAAICFQSWRLLGVVLAASAIYGMWVGDPSTVSIAVLNAIGWACMSVVMGARCPRCEYTLAPSRNPLPKGLAETGARCAVAPEPGSGLFSMCLSPNPGMALTTTRVAAPNLKMLSCTGGEASCSPDTRKKIVNRVRS